MLRESLGRRAIEKEGILAGIEVAEVLTDRKADDDGLLGGEAG